MKCRLERCDATATRDDQLCQEHYVAIHVQEPTTPKPWVRRWLHQTNDRKALALAQLRAFADDITPRDIEVFVIPEVNDVTLVTDDDGLPIGWSLCTLCAKPTRDGLLVCAECRFAEAINQMVEANRAEP